MIELIKAHIKMRHIALMVFLALLASGIVFYLNSDQNGQQGVIRQYDEARDFVPLVKIMNDNKYWISENASFSPERMLRTRAPYNDPERMGQALVYVVDYHNKTAGFIAFYLKTPFEGAIWLLGVDKEARGHGFGRELILKALDLLKKRGATYVTLGVRIINEPAIRLYRSLGFTERSRDDERGVMEFVKLDL